MSRARSFIRSNRRVQAPLSDSLSLIFTRQLSPNRPRCCSSALAWGRCAHFAAPQSPIVTVARKLLA